MQTVSTKAVTIHVDAQHIANGRGFDPGRCPIALALADQLGWKHPFVYIGRAIIGDGELLSVKKAISLPMNAVRWGQAFDLGQQMKPFTFKVEVPS